MNSPGGTSKLICWGELHYFWGIQSLVVLLYNSCSKIVCMNIQSSEKEGRNDGNAALLSDGRIDDLALARHQPFHERGAVAPSASSRRAGKSLEQAARSLRNRERLRHSLSNCWGEAGEY